ncbi:hypothetical protein K501DRAFT_335371 [Backusella circina FSU 941]|nr:hypothetical protein K501DRAFT_335371 [Backusella circina FSU 941]
MSTDPWDDWETAADAGLNDYKPKEKAKVDNKELWEKANQYTTPVIIMSDNNHTPAADYKPSIKVLKRPENASTIRTQTTKAPVKSLADREKDYEEARRKIFGQDDTSKSR